MVILSRIVALLFLAAACASSGPPFDRLGDMSPSEKSRMRTRRILLGKLNAAAQKAVRCELCDGRGYIVKKVRFLLPGNFSVLKDRRRKCPLCFGAKIHPWANLNHKLTKYFKAKRDFERDYPFRSPLKTGLKSGIFRRITTSSAWRNVNTYALQRIISGKRERGEAFLVVVRIESSSRSADGNSTILHALALDPAMPLRGLPVTLYLRDSKLGLAPLSAYLVLAWDDGRYGEATHETQLANLKNRVEIRKGKKSKKHPNPLTVLYFKHMKG